MDRTEATGVAGDVHKALKDEFHAVSKLEFCVRKLSFLLFNRMEKSRKLRSRLQNENVPVKSDEIGKRVNEVASSTIDAEMTQAYKELMEAIEALPIQSRVQAVEVLRGKLGE